MSTTYETADPLLYGKLKEYARQNKENPTEAERILWRYLQKSQLGKPFRRQHIIGAFIVDYVCLPARLVIEVDGGYHQLPDQQISDEERSDWLNRRGYKLLRFTNEEVIFDTDKVRTIIKEKL